jgi:hypothetical protein
MLNKQMKSSSIQYMKTIMATAAVASALVVSANAGSLIVNLPDIGTFAGYTDANTSDTFGGSGFLGIYPTFATDEGSSGPQFAHLFGLENYNGIYSETELQASLAGLSGATINSAYLSFSLLSGTSGNESVNVTSFSTAGTLAYNTSAPNDLGSVNAAGITGGANTINVTSLVSGAVDADQAWLGLYLAPQGPGENFLWTYTYGAYGADANSADVSLVINYTGGSVPDASSTAALLGLCVTGLVGLKRKK